MNYQDKINSLASNLIIERKAEPIPEVSSEPVAQKYPTLFGISEASYDLWKGNGAGGSMSMTAIIKAAAVASLKGRGEL